jgi:hypothetical protein
MLLDAARDPALTGLYACTMRFDVGDACPCSTLRYSVMLKSVLTIGVAFLLFGSSRSGTALALIHQMPRPVAATPNALKIASPSYLG